MPEEPSAAFQPVLDESSLPDNGMERVEVGGRRVALIKRSGKVFALDDECPHLGGSLSRGTLKADRVICPLHHWSFELETGRALDGVPGEKVTAYPVKVEQGRIWVAVPGS